jgi:hypothetical protein
LPALKDWQRFDRIRRILATMGNAQRHATQPRP